MNNRLKLILSGIAIIIALYIGYRVIKIMGFTKFYYPDREYQVLMSEKRYLDTGRGKPGYEQELVKTYLLGPLDYQMKLDIDPDSYVENIWVVDENGTGAIIINFSGNFSNNIIENNDSYAWMVRGLIETLKENTKVGQIYLLQDDEYLDALVGDWNIFYPIPVK